MEARKDRGSCGSKPDRSDALAYVRETARELHAMARSSHDWEHTERVVSLCEKIGPKEGADREVLRIAAYLHDIGRSYQDVSNGAFCHARKGAQMAEPLLEPLSLSPAQKANMVHCIRSHRFRGDCPPAKP